MGACKYTEESRKEWFEHIANRQLYMRIKNPTDDQIDGLKYAIESLPEPIRSAMIYYWEKNGRTFIKS